MNKKEKEARIRNHQCYWDLADIIREISLNALCENLSTDDVISVLDRIKTELVQRAVVVELEEQMQNEQEEEAETEVESGPDLQQMVQQVDAKTTVPLTSPIEMMNNVGRDINN